MSRTTDPHPKLIENLSLLIAGILAMAPLHYQIPRWSSGLDPTYVFPRWMASSPFPFVLHMAAIHPVVWIALSVLIFWRLCRNYGWRLEHGL